MKPILVVGLTAAGASGLPPDLLAQIQAADLLVGGRRHLSYFPHFQGETFLLGPDMDALRARLYQAWGRGQQAVVLASGDPLCYGIGSTLRRFFPPEMLRFVPAPTAFQLAFAALGEPWHDATLVSAHGRPLDQVVQAVRIAAKAAILTDPRHTPAAIGRALLNDGLGPDTAVAVCENLGGPTAHVARMSLSGLCGYQAAPLNVVVVWNPGTWATAGEHGGVNRPVEGLPPGLPDTAFRTEGGQITKREVRLLSLAELALGPGEILWDIGAGSGALSIEAARARPTATVYAVERREILFQHLQENLRRFPAPNLRAYRGNAPEACTSWPDPHAVFIGGSGGQLPDLIALAQARLRPGGRLVVNLVTLDSLATALTLLPAAQLVQLQVSRAVPILETLRFQALNPVFILTWRQGGTAVPAPPAAGQPSQTTDGPP